ncbi:MAG: RtcB family protein [Nitrososphaerales archaeon]
MVIFGGDMSRYLSIIKKVGDYIWEIPTSFKEGMRVPGRIYASESLIKDMDEQVYDQITNVATLPGILKYAYCMPDGHSGYGFPIGGVAAMNVEENGVISPGGIGFDINCGMRLILTNLTYNDVKPKLKELVDMLFERVPAGVGSTGFVKITPSQFREVVEYGAKWCIERGYGWEEDLERTEEYGIMKGANSNKISDRAIQRGLNQIGTLGSGNHYLEIQWVKKENIFDEYIADKMGFFPDQIVVMFHCGSRGFGHQVATDYLQIFLNVMERKYRIKILDRELACAPFNSPEGQDYFEAMKCGINMSFANRQTILHRVREVFSKIFNSDPEKLGLRMVYDVAHNTAKLEEHCIDGVKRKVLVHRKGATRAFGPGREEVPDIYRDIGQPVIIGGSMETGSYLLLGTKRAEEETFGTTAHGSGRTMSRTKARKIWRGERLQQDMMRRGIYVRSVSYSGLAEEAGGAYKDIDEVINATHYAGISKKIIRFLPIGNIKG